MPTATELAACTHCPRLVQLRDEVRLAHPTYHAAPVGAWGSRRARLLIVGLAPGMHGANRTGQPFTGDASGDFLFEGLARAGFASHPMAGDARLLGCRITNAVKCLPPGNQPVASEVAACRPYLVDEISELWTPGVRQPRCVLALGGVAYRAVAQALNARVPPFAHAALTEIQPRLFLAASFHPSRLNVNTGRLTREMFDALLRDVADVVGQ